MNELPELKNCPFCNANKTKKRKIDNQGGSNIYLVVEHKEKCPLHSLDIPFCDDIYTEREIIENWNNRTGKY